MSIKEKLGKSTDNSWLSDSFTFEESITRKYIAQIAATIQRHRKAKGYTQQELADILGVSQAMVSRWENGEENFTIATLARISRALGIALYNPLEKRVV
ncbi:MAG: helix-turn-helix transcriptional regulator [Clostridiales bacterium]|nr:helix-turn-helix transcriptional regulator [Clostridiales bacterium]